MMQDKDFIAACIIPTGLGASIGGFAGDASARVNLLSKVCPIITNPNSVNAAVFSGINNNILYTEGFALDSFFKGEITLRPSKHNKIGILFDKAIPEKVLNAHLNTLNALKTTYGLNISGYEITNENVGADFFISESGISSGNIKNPQTLLKAVQNLIAKGTEAIAAVCYFEAPENDIDYSLNSGVDPVGGVEAIVSHLIVSEFGIPAAHAPAFDETGLFINSEIVDKRAAAEYITPTFLPCIVQGLYNAPKFIKTEKSNLNDIAIDDVKAVVMPFNCLGGIPVISAVEKNIPVIAVEENKTVLNVSAKALGIENNVTCVKNYYEAAGILLSMKNGIYF